MEINETYRSEVPGLVLARDRHARLAPGDPYTKRSQQWEEVVIRELREVEYRGYRRRIKSSRLWDRKMRGQREEENKSFMEATPRGPLRCILDIIYLCFLALCLCSCIRKSPKVRAGLLLGAYKQPPVLESYLFSSHVCDLPPRDTLLEQELKKEAKCWFNFCYIFLFFKLFLA